jgi:DNA-binding transcriptional MerR regulator
MKAMIAFTLAGNFDAVRSGLAEHRAALEKALEGAIGARAILEKWNARTREDETNGVEKTKTAIYRSEAAARVGVAGDTLRDWERNGLVSPARLPNGRRVYSEADVEKLMVIRVLRQADYSLMGLVNLFGEKTAIEDLTFARDRWDETLRSLIEDCSLLGEITDELERCASGQ